MYSPRFLLTILFVCLTGVALFYGYFSTQRQSEPKEAVLNISTADTYWFILHRQSGREELYQGTPGDLSKSTLVRTFTVKTGIPGERPTPLPQLVGREYWLIIDKTESFDNPETAPYFLQFDTDAPSEWPYGPVPYEECGGQQCDWGMPGYFGLHGTGGNPSKLSKEDPGSSGCVRHTDEDITYLYNLLDPKNEEIRYYIEDN